MTTPRRKILFLVLAALALLGAAVLVYALVFARAPRAVDDPTAAPYGRLKDKTYMSQIDALRAEQMTIAKRLAALKAELDALGEDETNAARKAEVQAAFDAAKADLERNRAVAMALVRARIDQENKAIEAKNDNLKKKGN